MRLPFIPCRIPAKSQVRFADVSLWIVDFGNGDDSGLDFLLSCNWDRKDGSTATIYELSQTAWAKRIAAIMERAGRDFRFAESNSELTLAVNTIRTALAPLLRFASWNAFDGEPQKRLLENLQKTLEKYFDDMLLHLRRLPNPSLALQAEIQSLQNALPGLLRGSVEVKSDESIISNVKKRKIIFPV